MTKPEIGARVRAIISDHLQKFGRPAEVTDASTLHDVGLDSLDQIEITFAIEDEFELELTDAEVEDLVKVGDLVALIVASPPCQEYSYMAMPWKLAKAKAAAIRADETGEALARLNAIFNACFRIQREASEAAGRQIPMVVENVRGAQPWVGRAAWNYGSYYLWGDLPALMPAVIDGRKVPGFRFDGSGGSFQTASVQAHSDGVKSPGRSLARGSAKFNDRIANFPPEVAEGRKGAGAGAGAAWFDQNLCQLSSKSSARKAASAKIAKIPFALSSHIARVYRPDARDAAA